jgi:hypothetical protein
MYKLLFNYPLKSIEDDDEGLPPIPEQIRIHGDLQVSITSTRYPESGVFISKDDLEHYCKSKYPEFDIAVIQEYYQKIFNTPIYLSISTNGDPAYLCANILAVSIDDRCYMYNNYYQFRPHRVGIVGYKEQFDVLLKVGGLNRWISIPRECTIPSIYKFDGEPACLISAVRDDKVYTSINDLSSLIQENALSNFIDDAFTVTKPDGKSTVLNRLTRIIVYPNRPPNTDHPGILARKSDGKTFDPDTLFRQITKSRNFIVRNIATGDEYPGIVDRVVIDQIQIRFYVKPDQVQLMSKGRNIDNLPQYVEVPIDQIEFSSDPLTRIYIDPSNEIYTTEPTYS